MTATLPPMIRFQPLVAGEPIPGGKVYFYAGGTTTPQNVYAADGTTSLGNNLTLDANGATDFRLGTGLTYKIDLKDAAGAAVAGWPVDLIVGSDGTLTSLADTSNVALGDALVGVKQPLTGATARTQHSKNADYIHAKDFGSAGGTTEVQLASSALSAGVVHIDPASTFDPASIIPKPGISYEQGRKTYAVEKADGEQFYGPSGEANYFESVDVPEVTRAGTGTDFTPSSTYIGIKFTTSADASFIQGVEFRLKKTGALTDTSFLAVALYTDAAGVPTTLLSSGGRIYGGQVGANFASAFSMVQNVTTELTPGTAYWLIITRSESGGAFVFDSAAGTGALYEGAALATLSDTNRIAYTTIFARSAYPLHTVGNHTHSVWAVTYTGVGVRGDSTGHYGGYFQSVADVGCRGTSTYRPGVLGTSTHSDGAQGETSSTTGYGVKGTNTAVSDGYPGVLGESISGVGVMGYTHSTNPHVSDVRALTGKFGLGSQQWNSGTAAPTTEQWEVGDIIWNSAPASGGFIGWVCTTAGVPGVWKTFGAIS